MTDYTHVYITIPDALVVDGNRLFRLLGQDGAPDPGATFDAPRLSASGQLPRTYGATYNATATIPFVQALIEMKASGIVPAVIDGFTVSSEIEDFTLTTEKISAVLAGMEISINQSEMLPTAYQDMILTGMGLKVIQVEI